MKDQELLRLVIIRQLVEAEHELARDGDKRIGTADGSRSEPLRPLLQARVDAILKHAREAGITIDRSLAVGEWAPRD